MPDGRSSSRTVGRARRLACLLGTVLLLAPLGAACDLAGPGPTAEPTRSSTGALTAGWTESEAVRAARRLLRRRARAVRTGDTRLLLADVPRGRTAFRARQRRWLRNLGRLPVQQFAYRLRPESLTRRPEGFRVTATERMQLRGVDEAPVVRALRFRVRPAPGGERLLLVSDRSPGWEAARGVVRHPWDRRQVRVRQRGGVLGVLDPDSVARAPAVLGAADRARKQVAAAVPYPWSQRVTVYALPDTRALAAVADLPGGDPDRVDGVSVSLETVPEAADPVVRVVLHPRMLGADRAALGRLLRHELVHVALAERDDRVPRWLSEGIAEYVAARPLPRPERTLSRQAVTTAYAGVTGLPADVRFNKEKSGAHYGLAWWACEVLADNHGEATLWRLLDAMGRREEGTSPDTVLRRVTGVSAERLAHRAAARIRATFDP